jgi:uncharacterized membrane protein YhiD involved in acid resistance
MASRVTTDRYSFGMVSCLTTERIIFGMVCAGVGFLGSGLIWKGIVGNDGGDQAHQVHGLTTAATVWLSAAGTGY